jgi:hypothetical protein
MIQFSANDYAALTFLIGLLIGVLATLGFSYLMRNEK